MSQGANERVDLPGAESGPAGEWVNLRDALGKIQGRYNRRTKVLIIVERKVETEYQLAKFDNACQDSTLVLG